MPSLEFVLPALATLLLSLSVHEAAHAFAADRLGDPTARHLGRLTLNPLSHIDLIGTIIFPLVAMMSGIPLIGWAKPVPVNAMNLRAPRRDFALVAAAGPASNVLLATVFGLVFVSLSNMGGGRIAGPPALEYFLIRAVELNVLLAVFNLLPVPPLDGGNVLAGLVPEGAAQMIDRLRPYGFVILYGLMFTGVFSAVFVPVSNFVWGLLL